MIGLIVRPGDTLIVAISRPITQYEAANLKKRLHEQLPGLTAVVVVDQVAGFVAYRPNGTEDS